MAQLNLNIIEDLPIGNTGVDQLLLNIDNWPDFDAYYGSPSDSLETSRLGPILLNIIEDLPIGNMGIDQLPGTLDSWPLLDTFYGGSPSDTFSYTRTGPIFLNIIEDLPIGNMGLDQVTQSFDELPLLDGFLGYNPSDSFEAVLGRQLNINENLAFYQLTIGESPDLVDTWPDVDTFLAQQVRIPAFQIGKELDDDWQFISEEFGTGLQLLVAYELRFTEEYGNLYKKYIDEPTIDFDEQALRQFHLDIERTLYIGRGLFDSYNRILDSWPATWDDGGGGDDSRVDYYSSHVLKRTVEALTIADRLEKIYTLAKIASLRIGEFNNELLDGEIAEVVVLSFIEEFTYQLLKVIEENDLVIEDAWGSGYFREFLEEVNINSLLYNNQLLDIQEDPLTFLDTYKRPLEGVISDMVLLHQAYGVDDFRDHVLSGAPLGYADFTNYIQGNYTYEKARIKAIVRTEEDQRSSVKLNNITVQVDIPDTIDRSGEPQLITEQNTIDGGLFIPFNRSFYTTPEVLISIADTSVPKIPVIVSKDNTGFTVRVVDTSDQPIAATISWIAQGY